MRRLDTSAVPTFSPEDAKPSLPVRMPERKEDPIPDPLRIPTPEPDPVPTTPETPAIPTTPLVPNQPVPATRR